MPRREANHGVTVGTENSVGTTKDWRPHSEEIHGENCNSIMARHEHVGVQFWADWNRADKPMDDVIQRLKPRLVDWIEFYACDVSDIRNTAWCVELGIVNIPCVVVFRNGTKVRHIMGLRDEKTLASELLLGISSIAQQKRNWWQFW